MSNPWRPIETAPRDGPIDIWATLWVDNGERQRGARFADCRWMAGGSIGNPTPRWSRVPKGWRAEFWMEPPPPPDGDP